MRLVGQCFKLSTIVLVLWLSSCSAETHHQSVGDATLLRQAHAGDEYPAGQGFGRLVVSNGCVALDNDGRVTYVLWYPDTTLTGAADDLAVIAGDERASMGEYVEIGGGYRDLRGMELVESDPIPEPCRVTGSESYFIHAGGLAHVAG
jgi:hypothetical protein